MPPETHPSLNANALIRSAFWMSDNIRGTHHADTLFFNNSPARSTSRHANRCIDETNWQSWINHNKFVDSFKGFFIERNCQSFTMVLVIRQWSPLCKQQQTPLMFPAYGKKSLVAKIPLKYKYYITARISSFPMLPLSAYHSNWKCI